MEGKKLKTRCPSCGVDWVGEIPAAAAFDLQLQCLKCRSTWPARASVFVSAEYDAQDVDNVNRPAHYTEGKVECIDAIEAALTPEEFRGYCKGNVIKYTWRERHKEQETALAKAEWYLRRLLGKR